MRAVSVMASSYEMCCLFWMKKVVVVNKRKRGMRAVSVVVSRCFCTYVVK